MVIIQDLRFGINSDRIRLLVERLRSGTDIQGYNRMEYRIGEEIRRCGLGVTCRVAMDNGLLVPTITTPNVANATTVFGSQTTRLPLSVMSWYGFKEANPWCGRANDNPVLNKYSLLAHPRPMVDMMNANDVFRWSFPKMADKLEETYLA